MHSQPIILLVEDDIDLNKYLTHILAPKFRVLSATSGAQAIEFFEKYYTQIAALVLDIRLTDMSAFELLDQFEKISFVGVPPTIIQTAYNEVEWIQKLLGDYRALRYLVKPFEDEQLLEAIDIAIQSDPFIFKWSQINERLDVLQLVGELRSRLYQLVLHLSVQERDVWMPKVMTLFQGFTLKTPLETMFEWVLKFQPQVYIPEPKPFKIACATSKLHDYLQLALAKVPSDSKLDPLFQIEVCSLAELGTQPWDFVILDLDSDPKLESIKTSFQPKLMPYLVGISFSSNHHKLESAIQDGLTFALMDGDKTPAQLKSVLIRFAKRKQEVVTLEAIVESL